MVKLAPVSAAFALHELFGKVWISGRVPFRVERRHHHVLYKGKGSKNDCNSYRPISLLSVPGKVFTHALLARINPCALLKSRRRPQQSGFTTAMKVNDRCHSRPPAAIRITSGVWSPTSCGLCRPEIRFWLRGQTSFVENSQGNGYAANTPQAYRRPAHRNDISGTPWWDDVW